MLTLHCIIQTMTWQPASPAKQYCYHITFDKLPSQRENGSMVHHETVNSYLIMHPHTSCLFLQNVKMNLFICYTLTPEIPNQLFKKIIQNIFQNKKDVSIL